MSQFIIQLIKFGLVFLVPVAFSLPGSQTACIIGVALKGSKLREGVYTALKGDLRRGQQLFVFYGQLVFLLQIFNDCGRECPAGNFGIHKHQITVFRSKLRTVGGLQHRLRPCLITFLQLGICLIPKLHFPIIKGVTGINGVADMGKIGKGADVLIQLLMRKEQLFCFSVAFGRFQLISQAVQL